MTRNESGKHFLDLVERYSGTGLRVNGRLRWTGFDSNQTPKFRNIRDFTMI